MTPRKKALKAVAKKVSPVDPINSEEVVEDVAFNNRVRRLTAERRWAELQAAFLLHGSALTDRDNSRQT